MEVEPIDLLEGVDLEAETVLFTAKELHEAWVNISPEDFARNRRGFYGTKGL